MEQQSPRDESSDSKESKEGPLKKPYSSPRLIVHGTVEDITKSLAGGPGDGVLGHSA